MNNDIPDADELESCLEKQQAARRQLDQLLQEHDSLRQELRRVRQTLARLAEQEQELLAAIQDGENRWQAMLPAATATAFAPAAAGLLFERAATAAALAEALRAAGDDAGHATSSLQQTEQALRDLLALLPPDTACPSLPEAVRRGLALCREAEVARAGHSQAAAEAATSAGLLERYEENAAPGAEPSAPAPMTWAEIAAASRTDPMISSLIDCAQTGFARPLTHREMEKLVNLYVQEGFAPETVMLCVAYVASCGKRTMAAVVHELKVWRTEGVETGEQADAHLKLLALRRSREQYVSGLLGISTDELTLGGRKAIARWYEVYGYDDAMVQEAAVQAGPKRDLWYWNSILKTWNAKGLRTIHDVRGPVADAGASRNIRVDREAPSGNDFLGSSSLSASLNRLKKRSNT